MPLCDGSLVNLANAKSPPDTHNQLCTCVLEQMLSALDYLANMNLIHRDIKPENILYTARGQHLYRFQLADFGLAQYRSVANSFCGTFYYQAPEFHPQISNVYADQSHKSDIWSLFATMMAFKYRFDEFPPSTLNYRLVVSALRAQLGIFTHLEPMARLHPDRRASAAQLLVLFFDGRGLTTPKSQIPPLQPDAPLPEPPGRNPATRNPPARALRQLNIDPRLIIYPPRIRGPRPGDRPRPRPEPQPQAQAPGRGVANPTPPAAPQPPPIRAHRDRVAKRRAEPRPVKPTLVAAAKFHWRTYQLIRREQSLRRTRLGDWSDKSLELLLSELAYTRAGTAEETRRGRRKGNRRMRRGAGRVRKATRRAAE